MLSVLNLRWPACEGMLKLCNKCLQNINFTILSFCRCGATNVFFYLEVGRITKTGAGEIWMETGDPVIAENMATIILK